MNKELKQYWNDVSSKKQFTTPFQSEVFANYVNKDDIILDVGCGYGRTLNELYTCGYNNLIGIDLSEGMINRGKKQFPYLDLRVKTEDTIDMKDSSVDAVILFGVLTCIPTNTDQIELINDIHRVLKTNGILYVNDFLINSDFRNRIRYKKYEKEYGIYGTFKSYDGGILRHHSEEWVSELLSNFTKEEYKCLTFKTMNGNRSKGFYYIGRK